MLDLLRSFSKGWIAKILIGLLVLSFGVWGITGSLFFGSQTTVVEVGDTKVDTFEYRFAYDNQVNAFSRNIGRRITQQEADALGFRQNVLTQVIAGAVLDENAREMGLGVSDENLAGSIGEDPMFRDLSGNFSRGLLQSALRNAGMSENDYIESRRRVSARNQILEGTAASMSMPEVYAKALSKFQNGKRVFDYAIVGSDVATDIPEPTFVEVDAFYDANKSDYIAPQYRKVAILKLEPSDVSKPQEVTGEELQASYENRKNNLKTPERREIEQLVLNSGTVEEVKQQLADGSLFETIVTDQGKTLADINLGTLARTELPDEAVAAAAFSAEPNKPSEIIEGIFGPVLIRVIKIEEETTTAFDEIKDELRNQLALERAIEDVFAGFDAIEEERGAGETLLASGDKLGFAVRTIDAIDATGLNRDGNTVNNLPATARLLQEVFDAQPGDDTQAIEIGDNGFLWYDVLEIIPERQKPLDEVRDQVITAWKSAETDKKILAVTKSIRDRVDAGEDFNTVLMETLPTDSLGQAQTFTATEPLARTGQTQEFPATAVREGFSVPIGDFVISDLGNNQQVLFRVKKAEGTTTDKLPDEIVGQIDEAGSQDILTQVVADLQGRKPVLVNQTAIDIAFNPYGGNGGQY